MNNVCLNLPTLAIVDLIHHLLLHIIIVCLLLRLLLFITLFTLYSYIADSLVMGLLEVVMCVVFKENQKGECSRFLSFS